ncbi:MAG: AMP-binding enzyme, partial [Acidimicrobiales bacterium]
GYSVYALEVEQALEQHPDVAEASVVGLPDDLLGEVPVAAVRLRKGSLLAPDDVIAWADEHLAAYKVPKRVVLVEDLPRTGTNKVQKAELLALFD